VCSIVGSRTVDGANRFGCRMRICVLWGQAWRLRIFGVVSVPDQRTDHAFFRPGLALTSAKPIDHRRAVTKAQPCLPRWVLKLLLRSWDKYHAADTYAGDDEGRIISALNQLMRKYGPKPRNAEQRSGVPGCKALVGRSAHRLSCVGTGKC
jgi:hypothetical protein